MKNFTIKFKHPDSGEVLHQSTVRAEDAYSAFELAGMEFKEVPAVIEAQSFDVSIRYEGSDD